MTHTVWFDAARDNFWRIPDGADLTDGDVEIRNLAGERRQVDLESLRPHAMEREEARQAIFEQLRSAASTAGRALGAMAQGWLEDAQSVMPDGVSFEELEERLGPMEGWLDSERAKETLQSGAQSVRRTAQQAQDTIKRTSRVAGSAMRSARVVGKVMLDNPEIAETAGRMAQAVARVGGQLRRGGDKDKD